MKKSELITPAVLVDLDILERNIQTYQQACDKNKKELWPMTKTHKSTAIMKMQLAAGAAGFLGGTLEECEAGADLGVKKIMYAYPLANRANIKRAAALAKRCDFILRIDNLPAARLIQEEAARAGVTIGYTIIIDMGFHRFGVLPENAADFAREMAQFPNLAYRGISTHPGTVYGAVNQEEVQKTALAEGLCMKETAQKLTAAGFPPEYVTSGATPTHRYAVSMDGIQVYHPGNYVFHDNFQIANGTASLEDCALSVLTTIIAQPGKDLFLCDAGSKCLGLDRGAHGLETVSGFGIVRGHGELSVLSLSEEVGKLKINGPTDLKIGDMIEISPNHSCPVASSLTDYLVGCRGDTVTEEIRIDLRENNTSKIPK